MNPSVSLTQVQTNKLNISPQFMQSVHIMHLSSAELVNYLQEQSVENPLLDIAWPTLDPGKKIRLRSQALSKDSEQDWLNNVRGPEETLEIMLLNQLQLIDIPDKIRKIARYFAGNLNEHGYLSVDIHEAGALFHASIEEAQSALRCLQSLDPPGVGARDLRECLLLQIGRDRNASPWAYRIVSDFLKDLAGGKHKRISDKLNISIEEVNHSLRYIRSLNPRPGLPYSNVSQKYIVPDAIILKRQNGCQIIMNESGFPTLSINHYYQQLLSGNECKEAKHFLRSYLQTANGLIRGLEERQKTLYKVIETIVQEQFAFFEKGKSHLKPMNLKAVAEILKLHESTVSRAVQNKYVQTQHGLFELGYFFASGLSTDDGMATSAESVKERIKTIIQNEDKRNPLSDQQIMEILVKEKIQISRRTVMKYREELKYLSSRLRGSC
ncbi:RNA polymerase factor sigma-54 [Paenibacillus hamazuiensis]|uniref:RNA polymerase factor sigma-54 n=1 Tax=Paenibacillus hamazuiensis TaxID=2936508 RepID=UPI00200E7E46|nr:RNA polymerase factor sigma-54 [Paenibacillus hamazuiensis]